MKTKHRYTVRKMSSGYTGKVTYYVYDTIGKGRVTVHAHLMRDTAQMEADSLNISEMVKPHAEDSRSYEIRLEEAKSAFRNQFGKPLVEVL